MKHKKHTATLIAKNDNYYFAIVETANGIHFCIEEMRMVEWYADDYRMDDLDEAARSLFCSKTLTGAEWVADTPLSVAFYKELVYDRPFYLDHSGFLHFLIPEESNQTKEDFM